MPESSIVKIIHKWKAFTRRTAGRPMSRLQDVRNDLKMKFMKWTEKVQDCLKWKAIVEKAKIISFSAMKKR